MLKSSLILASLLAVGVASASPFYDDYSSASQLNYYTQDRSPAQVFETTNFGGSDVAHLKVWDNVSQPIYNSSFYNFQGYDRFDDVAHTQGFGLGSGSFLSVDLYVPTSWNGNDKRGGDLWARIDDTTQSAGNDPYPTIGIYNYGAGDGAILSLYTPYDGGFHDYNAAALSGIGAAINFDGWNNLKMVYNGTSGVDFYLNNTFVFADTDPGYADTVSIENAFLQGWRPSSMLNTGSSYDIYFDNLQAGPVPEPASLIALGLGAAGIVRKRKRAKETAKLEKSLRRAIL